jgi:hypothetical protein
LIAALFVATNGCYFGLDDVEPYDVHRDARLYAGPHAVIAHPPCERWGRYWDGGPSARGRFKKGDDGGCFKSALASVRRWGGVLEHPSGTSAWEAFGIGKPRRDGGWFPADSFGGWTCCVDQGLYGHRASKATWLYVVRTDRPELFWGKANIRLPLEGLSPERRARQIKTGVVQNLSRKQRTATPLPFRDLLISIARSALTA